MSLFAGFRRTIESLNVSDYMQRKTNPDDTFVEYICDQLGELDGIGHRRLFGGYGLYCGSTFFGIVYRKRIYLKTDETTRQKYESWGSERFQPTAKQTLRAYFEVPADTVDDAETLLQLAEEAVDIARRPT